MHFLALKRACNIMIDAHFCVYYIKQQYSKSIHTYACARNLCQITIFNVLSPLICASIIINRCTFFVAVFLTKFIVLSAIFIIIYKVYSSFRTCVPLVSAHSGLTLSWRSYDRVFRIGILRPFRTLKRALQTCGEVSESLLLQL